MSFETLPTVTLDRDEEIYWLLTVKGLTMVLTDIWKNEGDDALLMYAANTPKIVELLSHRRAWLGDNSFDAGTQEERATWLTWGEDSYANTLDDQQRQGILHLSELYSRRVFYRHNTILGNSKQYNYDA